LKSLAGSFKEAPLKKASFNIDLYNSPVVTLRFRPQYSSIERDVGMTTLSNTPLIRSATADDAARIGAIAHAAFAKYVPRIGREPSPMVADFDAEIAAHRIVVIETAGKVSGYMIAWPEADAYLIDNIAVDSACQGEGLGRRLMEYAAAEANRLRLRALRLYTNVLMIENLSMYAHLGFVETHRATTAKGFNVVYMRRSLPRDEQ
jgi:ribosomal protein S18 acetylase RimI-like enzyme